MTDPAHENFLDADSPIPNVYFVIIVSLFSFHCSETKRSSSMMMDRSQTPTYDPHPHPQSPHPHSLPSTPFKTIASAPGEEVYVCLHISCVFYFTELTELIKRPGKYEKTFYLRIFFSSLTSYDTQFH